MIEERVGTSLRRRRGTVYRNKGKWVAEVAINHTKYRIGRFLERPTAIMALETFLENKFTKPLKTS